MAEITKIEKLSGKNYQSWKYNVKLVLMEVDYGVLHRKEKKNRLPKLLRLLLKMLFNYVQTKRIP